MDIKELIKSIDTEGVIDKDQMEALIKNAEDSILEKCNAARAEGKKEGKEEALKEADALVKEAEKCGYEKGVKATLAETEEVSKAAEKNGYEAGVKCSLDEAEKLAEEYDNEVKEAVKELAEAFDQYAETSVTDKVKEAEEAITDKVVESLDEYLKTYVKEVIPESIVIDYDRIQKLESKFQILKESLMIDDEVIQKKVDQLDESAMKEVEKAKKMLADEVQKRIVVEHKMEEQAAKLLLVEKLQDIPTYEKNILNRKFAGCTVKEINESFDDAYAKIKGDLINETEKSKVAQTVVTETEKKDLVTESESAPKLNKETNRILAYAETLKQKSSLSKK